MNRPFFLALLLLVFTACQQQTTTETATISDDTLAAILADMAIAESAVSILTGYPRDSTSSEYYKQVYEIHGVTLDQFEQSMRVVVQDFQRFERIHLRAEDIFKEKLAAFAPDTTRQK